MLAMIGTPFEIGTQQIGAAGVMSMPCNIASRPYLSAFHDQVESARAYLLRYATRQLRDRAAAEDAVQETLVAALAGEASFGGRSNLRTWLTGILKHKIVD